ncbi:MAG TPA: hypothetical protein VHT50_27750, partial [Mycobacterium sp.]|nr:hypothetical protein [Mycobacterium sp.]
RASRDGRDVGGANRQPYTLSHFTTFIAIAAPRITADHRRLRPARRGATIGFMDSGPSGRKAAPCTARAESRTK